MPGDGVAPVQTMPAPRSKSVTSGLPHDQEIYDGVRPIDGIPRYGVV
jgi:hypothetical protein